MPDDVDLYRVLGRDSILHIRDHPHGRHEERHDYQNGNDGPGEFHLVAAVDLWRLRGCCRPARFLYFTTEYTKQAKDHHKNYGGNRQHED